MVSHYGVGPPELHAGHGHVGSRIGERGWITRLLALPPLAPGPPMAPTDSRYCWHRRSYHTHCRILSGILPLRHMRGS
jgi:hypothetical protein